MSQRAPRSTSLAIRVVTAVLLVLPFGVYLAVPGYARVEPRIAGFPFFYWWQLLWVILTAICIGTAYALTRRRRGRGDRAGTGSPARSGEE